MINVIYDRKTKKVIVTEQNGIYTLPSEYEVTRVEDDEEAFYDVCGEIYLKDRIKPNTN